jgi:arylsulfatase A-like enzyme
MKTLFGFVFSICLLSAASPAAAPAGAGVKPNILFILADDLGFSDLGCYGGEIATPNLDALASNGLRYTQFYNTARCWPSRAALLTGYYAQQVRRDAIPGVTKGGKGSRPVWAPLATEFLNKAGYRSYHSGKWHVDGEPLANGFAHSIEIGGKAESNYFKSASNREDGAPVPETGDYYATTAIADHAVRTLREHARLHPEQPFFHYLAFTAPHFPLQAPAADIAKYRDTYRKGWNAMAQERHARLLKSGIVRHALPAMEREVGPPYPFPDQLLKLGPDEVNRPLPWAELSESQKEFQAEKMAVHAAMVDRMDQEIGRVLEQLKKMGAFENTLVLFASDNGASAEIMVRGDGHDPAAPRGSAASFLCLGPGWSSAANTPMRRHKTWVHEGGISTPLIAHWPAGITARGELRHRPAHLVDVLPTLLELSGASKPSEIRGVPVPPAPGRSFASTFSKDDPSLPGYLWWQHEGHRALRAGDWKLVSLKGGEWELYDLSKDRGEAHNLAAAMPDRVRELSGLWEKQSVENTRLAQSDGAVQPAGAEGK